MNDTKRTPAIAVQCILDPLSAFDHIILTPAGGQPIRVNIADLSADIQRYAVLHGIKQKLVDAAAISRDPETGRSATVADKVRAVQDVLDRLLAGEWNKRREAGTATGGLLFAALCRIYPTKSHDDIRAFMAKLDAKQQAALRASPKVAPVIAEIKAERDAGDDDGEIDTDDLLAQI